MFLVGFSLGNELVEVVAVVAFCLAKRFVHVFKITVVYTSIQYIYICLSYRLVFSLPSTSSEVCATITWIDNSAAMPVTPCKRPR